VLSALETNIAAPLRDAAATVIRGVTPNDAPQVQRFICNLSAASRYLRFLRPMRELPDDMLYRFTHPSSEHEVVLVASTADDSIVGISQYVAEENGASCELAIVVADAWQRHGLGYRMLHALSQIATNNGIREGHADVLADNHAMRSLARKLKCEIRNNAQDPRLLLLRVQFAPEAVPLVPWSGNSTARFSASRTDCQSCHRY